MTRTMNTILVGRLAEKCERWGDGSYHSDPVRLQALEAMRGLYEQIDVHIAEMDMLAWESKLEDPPTVISVLTVINADIACDSLELIKKAIHESIIGGTRDKVLLIEGTQFESHHVPQIEIKQHRVGADYYDLMSEYLEE